MLFAMAKFPLVFGSLRERFSVSALVFPFPLCLSCPFPDARTCDLGLRTPLPVVFQHGQAFVPLTPILLMITAILPGGWQIWLPVMA